MADGLPQITEISHSRNRRSETTTLIRTFVLSLWSCWHGGINATRGTGMVLTDRPPTPRAATILSQDKSWCASCLIEKTYLCWYTCPPFLSDLRSLYTNTVVDRAHTYATIANVSHCWVFTEFSVSASVWLPCCIHVAGVTAWDWLTHWGPQLPDWTMICTRVDTQRRFWHGLGKPFLGDLVHHGWSWLTSEGVEVNLNVLHYIERNTGSWLLGWVLRLLGQNITTISSTHWWLK